MKDHAVSRLGRFAAVALVATLLAGVWVAPAAADPRDYEAVIDITFPVAGAVAYSDDYHQPRGGGARVHQGTDIMADKLQTVHAAQGGTITWITGMDGVPLGETAGYAMTIAGDDGLRYLYIHLNNDNPGTDDGKGGVEWAYAPGMRKGVRVERGQWIGYVGDSGNAEDTPPHLHFEIRDDRLADPQLDKRRYQPDRRNPYPSLRAAQERGDVPGAGDVPTAVELPAPRPVDNPDELAAADYVVDRDHADASDDNPGTADEPLATIQAAVDRVDAGETVLVRPGVYRESVTIDVQGGADAPATIRASDSGQVVVTGADRVSGWEPADDDQPIYRAPFPAWQEYGTATGGGGRRPQLVANGAVLPQVDSVDELFPGSFAYDPDDDGWIHLWLPPPRNFDPMGGAHGWLDSPVDLTSSDPDRHQIEASVRPTIMVVEPTSRHVVVDGFHLRYASNAADQAALRVGAVGSPAEDVTVVDTVVEWTSGRGVSLLGRDLLAERVYVRQNGALGAGGSGRGLQVVDSAFEGNNRHAHPAGPLAGGLRLRGTADATVRGSQLLDNRGPGLWLDRPRAGTVAEANFCADNVGPGVLVSDTAEPTVVRNNVCVRARGDDGAGVTLRSAGAVVAHNTLVGNAAPGAVVAADPESEHAGATEHTISNNVLVDNAGGEQLRVASDLVSATVSDHNLFSGGDDDAGWLAEWSSETGNDEHSVVGDPLFVSRRTHDFRLRPGSPAAGAGQPTEHVADDYLGRPRPQDWAPTIGALEAVRERPAIPTMPMRGAPSSAPPPPEPTEP